MSIFHVAFVFHFPSEIFEFRNFINVICIIKVLNFEHPLIFTSPKAIFANHFISFFVLITGLVKSLTNSFEAQNQVGFSLINSPSCAWIIINHFVITFIQIEIEFVQIEIIT